MIHCVSIEYPMYKDEYSSFEEYSVFVHTIYRYSGTTISRRCCDIGFKYVK